jgi:hypothetical protein
LNIKKYYKGLNIKKYEIKFKHQKYTEKGFEDEIITPANDTFNNFQFPGVGGNKTTKPTKQPTQNNSNNIDNYIYIGVAVLAVIIILKI